MIMLPIKRFEFVRQLLESVTRKSVPRRNKYRIRKFKYILTTLIELPNLCDL